MDRMRTRRPSMNKTLPPDAPKITFEDFKPEIKWSQDSSNHHLLIHLPGFRRDEITVQLEETGKILIRGSRKVSDFKFFTVDQSIEVPKDVIAGKISGSFQNGDLTLTMPIDKQKVIEKKNEATQQDKPKDEPPKKMDEDSGKKKLESGKKEDGSIQQEMPKKDKEMSESVGRKKDEPTLKETPKSDEKIDKGREVEMPKKDEKVDKETSKEERENADKEEMYEKIDEENKKVDNIQNERPKNDEKVDKETKKEEQETINEKIDKEKMIEDNVQNEWPKIEETMMRRAEEVMENISERVKDGLEKAQGSIKRGPVWRENQDGWLDYGLIIDGLKEKMIKNKKVIAVAVVAFSVGFYVSNKLRTSGK